MGGGCTLGHLQAYISHIPINILAKRARVPSPHAGLNQTLDNVFSKNPVDGNIFLSRNKSLVWTKGSKYICLVPQSCSGKYYPEKP